MVKFMSKKSPEAYQILQNDEIDLKALVLVLWYGKWSLAKITMGFLVMGIVYLIFSTPLYYSNAVIIPTEDQASSPMSSIASIASSVGMDLGQSGATSTVDLVDYVTSRQLRTTLLETPWVNKKDNVVSLINYWGIIDTSGFFFALKSGIKSVIGLERKTIEEMRLKWFENGRKILKERVIARHTGTGLIVVEVWMEDPTMAMQITNYVVESMIKYTKALKVKSWSESKVFLAKRMDEVSVDLKQAEDQMTQFQKDNRRITDSPDLAIELVNLRRDVEIKTQLYIGLQNQYEFARMEEAKDLTGIVVLDPAYYPVETARPQKAMVLMVSIILGAFLSAPLFLIYRGIQS